MNLISLVCSREALQERLQKDIDVKIREKDVISRSLERIALYEKLETIKVMFRTFHRNRQQN